MENSYSTCPECGSDLSRYDDNLICTNIFCMKAESDKSLLKPLGYYEERGRKVGQGTDVKQRAYGNAIQVGKEVLQVFMQKYYDDITKTYTIPEELLDHILIQVRIIDKQCRIFTHPKQDMLKESPYRDICGYSLLAMNDVVEEIDKAYREAVASQDVPVEE